MQAPQPKPVRDRRPMSDRRNETQGTAASSQSSSVSSTNEGWACGEERGKTFEAEGAHLPTADCRWLRPDRPLHPFWLGTAKSIPIQFESMPRPPSFRFVPSTSACLADSCIPYWCLVTSIGPFRRPVTASVACILRVIRTDNINLPASCKRAPELNFRLINQSRCDASESDYRCRRCSARAGAD